MEKTLCVLGALAVGILTAKVGVADPAKPCVKQAHSFKKTIMKKVQCNYLLYLPADYEKEKNKQWPLVLFLHGIGERGNDLAKLKVNGPPHMVDQGKQFPFILVAPQCPDTEWWENEIDILFALLDDIEAKYRVDKNREYLTGLSMGGYGTWTMVAKQPTRFAAIAPICGGGQPETASLIKDVPMWVFHGDKDDSVPLKKSQDMVDAIKAAGGNPKFTIYPNAGHDVWTTTYSNDEFWAWLLDQRKK